MIEMSQVISIEDLRDPETNPAAKWLHGNHTKVTWYEPNANGEIWPVYVWDSCSHDSSVGGIMVFFEHDIPWLRTEDGKIASFVEDLVKEKA